MDQTAVPFLKQFLAKYKPVLLILLVGIILMLLPVGSRERKQETAVQSTEKAEETVKLQDQLSAFLSQMAGAGKVQVLLTEAAGQQTIYQADKDTSTNDNSQMDRSDTVILTNSARDQEGLVCRPAVHPACHHRGRRQRNRAGISQNNYFENEMNGGFVL